MSRSLKLLLGIAIVLFVFAIIFCGALIFLTPKTDSITFPEGKQFGFTIFDDTDTANIQNVKPVYDALYELGIITTKSIWVLPAGDSTQEYELGLTISNPEYLEFVLDLKQKGFEIGYHGARGVSSRRSTQLEAMERFNKLIAHYPVTYANHSYNRDNLYWGTKRLDYGIMKYLYHLTMGEKVEIFEGNIRDSDYFWGDIAKENITYVRNFVFKEINVLKVNPSMPYHDKRRPFVNFWFSSSDGYEVETFNALLSKENLDRLEAEGGLCIVYTHFAGGFVNEDGVLNAVTRERLEDLASRNGYFVPVKDMLDLLKKNHGRGQELDWKERFYLQLRWSFEKASP